MGSFSFTHILILVILGLIFFGSGKKLPQLGQSIGKALRGFKEGLNEIEVDPKDIRDDEQQIRSAQNRNTEKNKNI